GPVGHAVGGQDVLVAWSRAAGACEVAVGGDTGVAAELEPHSPAGVCVGIEARRGYARGVVTGGSAGAAHAGRRRAEAVLRAAIAEDDPAAPPQRRERTAQPA